MSRDHTAAGYGTAVLTGGTDDESDTFTIHGIAIGSGDITIGSSGVKKMWPEDELREAAATLEGKPLVKDHENSVDGVIGRVTKTRFKPGTGILYEAELSKQYEDIAQKIADGLLEVSVRAYHAPTEELEVDDETGARVATDIVFDNLAVVTQGAAPSNTANAGEAVAMGQSYPSLSAAELRAEFDSPDDEEEAHDHGEPVPDMSSSPRSMMEDAPQWEDGDLVRWQVEPDLFGKIVHVDRDKHIAMVEVMGMKDGELTSTGFTITAGYSDITRMQMPESKADMSGHMKDEEEDEEDEMSAHVSDLSLDALTEHDGTVVWGDDNIGVVEDVTVDENSTPTVEIAVLEREDGELVQTDETVERTLEVESLEAAWHTPEWSGLDEEREWSKPAMEDFDTDDMSEIDNHFIVSKTGEWPPENYGDLALPVVWPNGDLSLDGLDSAHQMAGQVDGISDDMADQLQSKINGWAEEHFDEAVAGEEMSQTSDHKETEQASKRTRMRIAQIVDDSPNGTQNSVGTSELGSKTNTPDMDINYHDVDSDELGDEYVAVNEEDIDAVVEKARRADELDSRLDEMNSTLESLSEKTDILDDVDSDMLEELTEASNPVIVEADEYEAQLEQVDEVGSVFAELLAEEDSIFTAEELAERYSPLELKAKFEDRLEDDATLVDQLSAGDPEPEGDSVESEELANANDRSGGADSDTVSEEEARDIMAQSFEAAGYRTQAEQMRSGELDVYQYEDELTVDIAR